MNIWKKITNWEQWPFALLYAPIAPYWIYITLKSKYIWFFTTSNPKITFGGLTGESKSQQYEFLPKEYLPETIIVKKGTAWDTIKTQLASSNLQYPLIIKLDFGEQGLLMRKVKNFDEVKSYYDQVNYDYLIQAFSPYQMEVSVFYVRMPNSTEGLISGFLLKTPMYVIGDGQQTLNELILNHHKSKKFSDEMLHTHKEQLHNIIPKNEQYALSYAGNHNRGAQFEDLSSFITPPLTAIFDKISLPNELYYGRYDIKCESIASLTAGKNFHILEYNGCGAEPNHFYDTGYTLVQAYKEILKHWKWLYEICKQSRAKGATTWPFNEGRKFIKENLTALKQMAVADKHLKI
jgi:hypothetical protein